MNFTTWVATLEYMKIFKLFMCICRCLYLCVCIELGDLYFSNTYSKMIFCREVRISNSSEDFSL